MNRRLWLTVLSITILSIAVLAIGTWQLSRARHFQLFGELVAEVPTKEPLVALTLDDGPSAKHTEAVLAILRERGVTATFFVTGRETEANLDLARRIVADGHELGNHSYSHARMIFTTGARVQEEIERTDAAIRSAGHVGAIHFRPPYGHKLIALPRYLNRNDRLTVMWDIEPESYADIASNAEGIAAHVFDRVRPGSIVLLHVMYDSRAASRDALPLIVDGLRQRGYRFVTVSELLRKPSG